MKFVADLHIHSHYSRATSKNLDFEHLAAWAQRKGVQVVGTGDIAHPGWLQEMRAKLQPAEDGLFRLKDDVARAVQAEVPSACHAPVRFLLAGEISSIYKKNDQVRKIHNVIFAPTLEAVEKIQAALEKIGNIRSDGRPILGLDARDLLEIILDIDPQNYLIPAHIWTPWFSLLGSKSGFDSLEECFDDLTPHIFAVETGLSSDPPMNWRISFLDRYTLVSNSDAHSPQKLAREANLFDTELSYPAIFAALKRGDPNAFLGTIEFFPEEGKYHHDGHRKCGINWEPKTTIAHNGICPECGKPVTVGVLHRVETLADRDEAAAPPPRHGFTSLIPLPEVLGEIHGVGSTSKTVQQAFELLLARLGPELSILQDIPLADIEQAGGPLLAEGIRRMRAGQVRPIAGFDGQPGIIKLFGPQERRDFTPQLALFELKQKQSPASASQPPNKPANQQTHPASQPTNQPAHPPPNPPASQPTNQPSNPPPNKPTNQPTSPPTPPPATHPPTQPALFATTDLSGLNPEQQAAVLSPASRLVIVAGPGTGKTRALTYRLARLVGEQGVAPESILAITFTNKAAEEMAARLQQLLGGDLAGRMVIKTFHAFGVMLLREAGEQIGLPPNFAICSEPERLAVLKQVCPEMSSRDLNRLLDAISAAKGQLLTPAGQAGRALLNSENLQSLISGLPDNSQFAEIYRRYEAALADNHLLDFDDLVLKPVRLLESKPDLQTAYRQRFGWISVDEFQDVNLAQYRLLQLLAGPDTNICLIGDPDQAIYGFRGASPKYFRRFSRDFAPVETLHLSRNYRSTQLILNASTQVIDQSAAGERVKVWSDVIDKTRLELYQAPTGKAEAEYVVHRIEQMVGGTSYFSLDSGRVADDAQSRAFGDFAVLYRLGAQSQPLIEAFERSGMPYQTSGQTPLGEYQEVRTVLACLWRLYNPDTSFHLEQVVSQKQMQVISAFLTEIESKASVPALVNQIEQFLVERSLLSVNEKSADRLQQLRRRAIPFENRLGEFLESMSLQKETDFYDPRADRVALLTLHAAKGLEFPVVFIVGCEEGLLPYHRGDEAPDIDEERRLLYVGMTRAQQKLILTHAGSRFLFGTRQENAPSRFVDDIEAALKELKEAPRRRVEVKPEELQLRLF